MKVLPVILTTFALMTLCGCATSGGNHRNEFGAAYRSWFSGQVFNKDAPTDPSPSVSFPGKVAAAIEERRYIPEMTEKKTEEKTTNKSRLTER